MVKSKRTDWIKVRVTPEEKLEWEAKAHAAGLPMSELIRQSLQKVRVWNVKDRSMERSRTAQIARIGNNLNQLARWANTYKSALDTIQIITYLKEIKDQLKQLKYPPKKREVSPKDDD